MLRAERILQALRAGGITDVAGLPDNTSAALFALLRRDPGIRLHTVTREGEAFALAAGLWVGGRRPAVLIQNTGFLESGDSFRGTVSRMRVPVLCLITYRGHAKLAAQPEGSPPRDPETLSRPDLDSVAVVTEPTLRAWGLPYDVLDADAHVERIGQALARADATSHPVALLVTREMGA